MGIYDRDWHKDKNEHDKAKGSLYDPKHFRREDSGYKGYRYEPLLAPAFRSNDRPPRRIGSVATWLLLLLGFTLFYHYAPYIKASWNERRKAGLPPTHSLLTGNPSCNPSSLPTNGATQVADPSHMRRTDVLFSGLEIENKHPYPVVAYLTDLGTGQRILGMSVQAGKTAQTSVPVGNYGLFFFAGSSWCNDQIGFQDGFRVDVQGSMEVLAGGTRVLSLDSSGPTEPERFHISVSQRLPQVSTPAEAEPDVQGQDFVELVQRSDGHYYSAGYVNGVPIVFMVDTGATLTSLSQEMAHKAGIYSCNAHTFNTANGSVQGCVAKAPKIQIGSFVLRDFDVAILPNQSTDALLGMNVLRMLRLEQQSGVMRISIR